MGDENKFQEMTHCDDCPCINTDYEMGSDCNLGYEIDTYWTETGVLIYASFECRLEMVRYKEDDWIFSSTFEPQKIMARKKRTDGKW